MTVYIQHQNKGTLQHFTVSDSACLPRVHEYVLVSRKEYLVFKILWDYGVNPIVYIYVMDPLK